MYREVLVPVDNSLHSDLAVDRAVEICARSEGRITATHVYAARLHDVRFRQLEIGLPAHFQEPQEIRRQRKIHDKLIEKGLQLISDSFLDEVDKKAKAAGVPLTRQLLEGINFEEIANEANRGAGQLPSLIGFDPNIADKYDGGDRTRSDVQLGDDGRIIAEDEEHDERLAGSSERDYDLVVIGAFGIGRQAYSKIGGVAGRAIRKIEKDVLVVRDQRPIEGGSIMVCIDGSAYSYKCMRIALELAREYGCKLLVGGAFDVEYHHAVFNNIKDVLSVQASKVFKFEEQEELHNNIIDKGLLRLCKANVKRASVMASEFPDVEVETQILVGKPFQVILQWAEEEKPSLLVLARHGSHRIEGTEIGSQAEEVLRQAEVNTLLVGTTDVRPEDIPWIEEDGEKGLEWAPEAEVRILRVPPFALGIARKAVEEFVLEHYGSGSRYAAAFVDGKGKLETAAGAENGTAARNGSSANGASADVSAETFNGASTVNGASTDDVEDAGDAAGAEHATARRASADLPTVTPEELPVVTNERLDEAIKKLLPTHMQLIMGIGTAEELALAELKAEQAMKRTVVQGHDADPVPDVPVVETKCPYTGHVQSRGRTETDPVEWTHEAFDRLRAVPLIARPLARNTVEKFARENDMWRVTTMVMDENKQAMIEADTFDIDTMLVMFKELQTKQIQAAAEGVDGLTPEMRKFIEEAKAQGVTRCPIRDMEEKAEQCPVDFKTASPEEAKAAMEKFMAEDE
ncbi:MAG TPA: universal stress protein [Gemmatimonadota bacterium]|nr:universal stress protein [Gemmatimonadota bacterium]